MKINKAAMDTIKFTSEDRHREDLSSIRVESDKIIATDATILIILKHNLHDNNKDPAIDSKSPEGIIEIPKSIEPFTIHRDVIKEMKQKMFKEDESIKVKPQKNSIVLSIPRHGKIEGTKKTIERTQRFPDYKGVLEEYLQKEPKFSIQFSVKKIKKIMEYLHKHGESDDAFKIIQFSFYAKDKPAHFSTRDNKISGLVMPIISEDTIKVPQFKKKLLETRSKIKKVYNPVTGEETLRTFEKPSVGSKKK